jgi:hypothetical protein
MSNVSITMTDFTFPTNLKDAFATFRIQLVLSYTNSEDKSAEVKEILPGAGEKDYWECEKGHKNDFNFVRRADAPKIDMEKILEGGATATFADLKFNSLDSLMVTIYDVEKGRFFR